MPSTGQIVQPFPGNGDVSLWVKNSRVGRYTPNKQTKSVYNGNLRGPMILAPIAERLAVELFCGWDSNTQPSACGTNALTHCATAAIFFKLKIIKKLVNTYMKFLNFKIIIFKTNFRKLVLCIFRMTRAISLI